MAITVYGSGAWGTAIAMLLFEMNNEVTLWSAFKEESETIEKNRENPYLPGVKIPKGIKLTANIEDTDPSDLAVIAAPSFAVRKTAAKIKSILPTNTPVVCVSKGIEEESLKCFSDVISDEIGCGNPVVILSGPSHAEEVGRGIPTGCVAASSDIKAAEYVQDKFMNDHFRVYTTDDVIGVELAAALKNIIAFGAGVCDGMGYGDNTIAMLMTRGLAEMAELGVAMGGAKETFAGLAGMGDLIVTCTSRHSRNRRAGVLMGKGYSIDEALKEVGAVVESYYVTKVAVTLAQKYGVSMPITQEIYKVMYAGKSAKEAMHDLMSRVKRSEKAGSDNLAMENWVK